MDPLKNKDENAHRYAVRVKTDRERENERDKYRIVKIKLSRFRQNITEKVTLQGKVP